MRCLRNKHSVKRYVIRGMEKYMLYRPLSDMETDGVYFPDYIREKLEKEREEEICHYSGLPSLKMYMKEEVEYEGNHSS